MNTDELRAKFEATFCEWPFDFYAEKDEEGDYKIKSMAYRWEGYKAAHASRDAEVEALQAKVKWMREYEKGLNRRAEVEEVLFEVARGKRAPLCADECRGLAIKLGCTPK